MSIRLFITLAGLLAAAACSTSKTASTAKLSDNNVVNVRSKNSRYSSDKTDGQSTVIFKGKNNIINIDISDSDISSFNTKTVTIIEGDNNNFTSTTRKCVLVYKGRTDTIVIKGNQLKIDFTADSMNKLLEGDGGKEEITAGQELADFKWDDNTWKATSPVAAEEVVFVKELDKEVNMSEAFTYYTKQARSGSYDAFYMLGRFFDNLTYGSDKDILKAMEYYEVAARHDHPEAAFRLGYIYQVGDFEFTNVPVNRTKAEYYYTLAAKNGHEKAKEMLAQWQK